MADRATIQAEPRAVLGKKVKRLRRDGILPANVYGNGIESKAVQLVRRDFVRTVRASGVRSMFELEIAGEPEPRHVILRGLTRQGGTGEPMHVDFYQVDLRRPIQTTVRVHPFGVAPAVRDLAGSLLQTIETVSVRCLPLDLPDSIEFDIGVLSSFEITITVGDLTIPPNVEILTDASVMVATVNPPRIRLEGEAEEGEAEEGEEGEEGEEAAAETESE